MGMIPAVASAATGFVQFSVAPQYQFGTAGSYLSNGNTITKLFDNDLTTWWDAPAASGGYAGVDLTVPAKVTDLLIAPRTGYTARVYGVQIQGATTSSSIFRLIQATHIIVTIELYLQTLSMARLEKFVSSE